MIFIEQPPNPPQPPPVDTPIISLYQAQHIKDVVHHG
jgi:hypothetical protein